MQIHKSDPYYILTGNQVHVQALLASIPIF